MYVITEEQFVSDGGRCIDIHKFNVPIKIWAAPGSIEEGAIQQLRNATNLPFVFHHIAAMPDCHKGYGVTIGSVVACKGVISPMMVGVDIGCGMLAVKTSLTEISTERIKEIMSLIRKYIPVGFNHQKEAQDDKLMPFPFLTNDMNFHNYPIVCSEANSALKQLGTLGGGNHFIEIQKGSDGHIWFMIHSGSRNLGLKVAKHYNDIAKELNEKWFSGVNPKWELAFLPLNTKEADDYLREMNFCLDFALANRKLMAYNIKNAFNQEPCIKCDGKGGISGNKCDVCDGEGINYININTHPVTFLEEINIHHNYARMENHFGHNVMIHRKGATLASTDTIGLIPGSQGTCSYVVKGKGNSDSFMSCSHGAGRKMGRKEAIRSLDMKKEVDALDAKGIIHSIRNQDAMDEAPGAYKSIDIVMEEQKDLVDIVVKLEPLAVIKG